MEYIVSSCSKCGGWCCKCIAIAKSVLIEGAPLPSFWRQITVEEVNQGALNDLLAWKPKEVNFENFAFYQCEMLKGGLCSVYENRPKTCSDYPFYSSRGFEEYLDHPDAFYVPWCFYRMIVLESLGIEFEVLGDGDACLTKYLEQISYDSETAQKFQDPDLLISKAFLSSTDGTLKAQSK
jgi:Fe-S-cluster containining protein